jgi:hypothetical protein
MWLRTELRYGKNAKNEDIKSEMGNPQPSPKGTKVPLQPFLSRKVFG